MPWLRTLRRGEALFQRKSDRVHGVMEYYGGRVRGGSWLRRSDGGRLFSTLRVNAKERSLAQKGNEAGMSDWFRKVLRRIVGRPHGPDGDSQWCLVGNIIDDRVAADGTSRAGTKHFRPGTKV